MSHNILDQTTKAPKERPSLSGRLHDNPVALKELRSRMRGGRAFVVLTIYLVLVSALVILIYISIFNIGIAIGIGIGIDIDFLF